ncbi:hypothetical protein [Peribacillus kribbensis]|uniref:hypothetical protein n=1 Tax=Peribacillus kribbensis TaxID=356658 RepID=UPI0003F923D8|nr:hypothetical protein [Peribacillus kribbensis]
MAAYITDLLIVAILIISITALMGVIMNSIGKTLFSRGKKTEFTEKSEGIQSGWKLVGGRTKDL